MTYWGCEEILTEGGVNLAEKYDALYEMRRSLSASDFRAVLSYYNIPVKKNSILCPFHNDTHYGSCSINKDGRGATCWVCSSNKPGRMGRSISPVDVVMEREGLEYTEALEFLWCTILGRTMPTYQTQSKSNFPLEGKELEFIGMWNARGRMVPIPVNGCSKHEEIPKGMDKVQSGEACYAVIKNVKAPSIYNLYDTDKDAALEILQGKASETERYYLDLLGGTFDRESANWKLYCENREEVLGLRDYLHNKVAEARSISAKLLRAS